MKKYFIVSDTHSFLQPLLKSLNSTGFDINNREHILVIAGDLFDRGKETIELYNYLMTIPRERLVLVRGNHEELYLDLLRKPYPESYDFHNGTVRTFCAIAGVDEVNSYDVVVCGRDAAFDKWKDIVNTVKKHEITKMIKNISAWNNFYEIDNFVIVHSFIPLKRYFTKKTAELTKYEYNKDWRKVNNPHDWNKALWGCPWRQFDEGLFDEEIKNNKVLVCGHWHTSDFHSRYEEDYINDNGFEVDQSKNFTIYFGKNLIGIDGCLAYTNTQNVLVIDGDKCYDQNLKELKVEHEKR